MLCGNPIHLVLLDRDGVVTRDLPHSVRTLGELELLPGAASAIRYLNQRHIPVALVTNQSIVGRGLISLDGLQAIHAELERRLKQESAQLDHIYFCPDAPSAGSPRRKPQPGMITQAMQAFRVTPKETLLIGDSIIDLQAATAATCHRVLVLTGKGQKTCCDPMLPTIFPVLIYPELAIAIQQVL